MRSIVGCKTSAGKFHRELSNDSNRVQELARNTASSVDKWQREKVFEANRGCLFFYKGGTHGIYIECKIDGTLELGTYEGAIPHLGDAMFQVMSTSHWPTQYEAYMFVYQSEVDIPEVSMYCMSRK
jgi:hypothetical protein